MTEGNKNMRKIYSTIKNKVSIKSASYVAALVFSVLVLPVIVFAYGPERTTFTQANPATYVTFNSITDDPAYGDERNFYRIKDLSSGQAYGDSVNLTAGGEYEVKIFFHNNAASNFNESGVGVAKGAYTRAEMPAIVRAGAKDVEANAYVGATNANPQVVYDYIRFTNNDKADMALRLVPGTVKFQSYGPHDGETLSDTALFTSTGQPLGFDNLDGVLPGCDHYSGYITYRIKAVKPDFTFNKNVRLDGTKDWNKKVTVEKGAKVQYRLAYENTGDTQQKNVMLKDELPAGLTYVPGSTKIYTTSTPNGKVLGDEISNGTMIIGDYNPQSNAFLTFLAEVNAAPCSILTNKAYAVTNNGTLQDEASVAVKGDCAEALPTTGPVEVAAGLLGIGALTFGIVYYLKSRRDLEESMVHVGHAASNDYTSLGDVTKKAPLHKRILKRRKK